MRELLIATTNKGKCAEIRATLGEIPFTIRTLVDVEAGHVDEPTETLERNALIKAMTYGKRTGFLTLAEDTGLEVEALGGGPGVLTARYADESDETPFSKLLKEMMGVPEGRRDAQFRTVAVLYDPTTDKLSIKRGVCQGSILTVPRVTLSWALAISQYSWSQKQARRLRRWMKERARRSTIAVRRCVRFERFLLNSLKMRYNPASLCQREPSHR